MSKLTVGFKKTNDKNYTLFNENNKEFNYTLKNVYLKFGIEKYNDNNILNIFFDKEKSENNENYNSFSEICSIISKVSKITENKFDAVRYNCDGKGFQSPIKNEDDQYTEIRTYLSKNVDIFYKDMLGSLNINVDISKSFANVDLCIKTLWITENNFGVIIYVKKIELLKKIK